MRRIVKLGLRFNEWICPDCGQIERITEDEEPYCSNCSTRMIPHEEKPEPAEGPEALETPEPSELPPPQHLRSEGENPNQRMELAERAPRQ